MALLLVLSIAIMLRVDRVLGLVPITRILLRVEFPGVFLLDIYLSVIFRIWSIKPLYYELVFRICI
jgi:hypothetical protein